ncbi:MAG: DsbA family protein [Rhodospirillales bacterium]
MVQAIAVVLIVLAVPAAAGGATAVEARLAERSLGDPAAPVTLVEYSSLTCPHCATFHTETLPKIKEAYIDTGLVRLVYQDYPLDAVAMAAALVARCVDPSRYFGFLDVLYRDQAKWSTVGRPLDNLKQLGRLAGLSDAAFAACLDDATLLQGVQSRAAQARQDRAITSTPTFYVNDQKIVGAQGFEAFRSVIDAEIAKAR